MSRPADVEELLDRIAIQELRYNYCRHLDAESWDEWLALFTEDIAYDASAVPGMGVYEGKDALAEFVDEVLSSASEYSAHHAFHPIIDIDGDEAEGRWVLDEVAVGTDGSVVWMQGVYEDEYRRVDGEWKFAKVSTSIEARAASKAVDMHYPGE